ncbi:MAG: DUF2541 family protein [Saprospiraceae bacterium]|nr:DUF2541 family protein [Saprospiraceae bacterium]
MRNQLSSINLLLFLAFFSQSMVACTVSGNLANQPNSSINWVKLGSKNVKYSLDRDEIFVTARDGRFSKIKLKIRKGGVNMHKVVVHFGNGETQNVILKKNFSGGSETRAIDLKGGKRVIKKVVFWYDSKNVSVKKARVELWGKR